MRSQEVSTVPTSWPRGIEDPDQLTAPVIYSALWAHRPDLEATEGCDPEVAAHYLEG